MNRLFQSDEVKNYITNNKIRYVSFDLFDTLVFRSIHSSNDVYTLLHRRYDDIYGKSEYNLQKKRLLGEIKARNNSDTDDVTIEDIYLCIDLPDLVKEKLQKLECKLEIELSVPNQEIISFIKEIRRLGVTILITSDMYLDRNTIESILEKHNIDYDYLFLSGEVGLRKDTGRLFQYILSKLSIKAKDFIHIGDNRIADQEKPEQIGIRSYCYLCFNPIIKQYFINTEAGYLYKRRRITRRIYERIYRVFIKKAPSYNSIYSNCLTGNINAVCKSLQNDSVRLGYGVIGPFLVALCQWIHKQKNTEKLDQLWFVAREGYLIKNVYLALYPEDSEIIKYVRYNKNVLRLPFALSAKKLEEKKATLPSISKVTISDMLVLFNISDTEKILTEIRKETGYERDTQIVIDELNNEKNLILWNLLVRAVGKSEIEQKEMLIEHLHETLGKKTGQKIRVGLINNSINGNGQYILEKILKSQHDESIEFCGLQFIDSKICKEKGINYHAWLVEQGNNFYVKFFNRTVNVLERLLFENCGTAVGFKRNNNRLDIYCEERRREKENDDFLIPIQDEALHFAKQFKKFRNFDITKDALSIFFQMMSYPNKEDAIKIGNIAYDEIDDTGILIKKCSKKNVFRLLDFARREMWPTGFLSVNSAPKLLQDMFVWRDSFF